MSSILIRSTTIKEGIIMDSLFLNKFTYICSNSDLEQLSRDFFHKVYYQTDKLTSNQYDNILFKIEENLERELSFDEIYIDNIKTLKTQLELILESLCIDVFDLFYQENCDSTDLIREKISNAISNSDNKFYCSLRIHESDKDLFDLLTCNAIITQYDYSDIDSNEFEEFYSYEFNENWNAKYESYFSELIESILSENTFKSQNITFRFYDCSSDKDSLTNTDITDFTYQLIFD
jgi:hypothetical protein